MGASMFLLATMEEASHTIMRGECKRGANVALQHPVETRQQ
jgi:hypothetical protein